MANVLATLTFKRGHGSPCHGLPSRQFPASCALPFSS